MDTSAIRQAGRSGVEAQDQPPARQGSFGSPVAGDARGDEAPAVASGERVDAADADESRREACAEPPTDARRPYVHLNFAVDGSGRMARENGRSAALSCKRDWQRVHELRERYAAIGVGARTWLQDKPRLTVRRERLGRAPSRQPDRVIFAGRTPCRLAEQTRRSFIIGDPALAEGPGVHVPASDHDLRFPLEALARHKLDSLLVEGGSTLLRSFVLQRMFDRITIYVCTLSVGGAFEAVAVLLPQLPLAAMEARTFGRGILLTYSSERRDAVYPTGRGHAVLREPMSNEARGGAA